MVLDLDSVALKRAGELDAAAGDIGVCGLGPDHRILGDGLRRFCDLLVIGSDEPSLDRRARPRPALEQATLDQQYIRALAGRGHRFSEREFALI
ncbi:hypothetical protein ACVWWR_005553 [Bradyrhizobium sp. LM3.2]